MKYLFTFFSLLFLAGNIAFSQNEIQIDTIDNSMEDISYSLGALMATNVQSQNIENLDIEALALGLKDLLSGNEPKYTIEECNKIFSTFMTTRQALQFEEIRMEGESYLAENSKRPEVKTTESGLQYEIITEAEGPKPVSTDKVQVHYHGTLSDGTVFDSSVERGEPVSFGVSQLIPGWTEGLKLMSVGSKYKMYIPQDLAYGDRGAGEKIPPFSVIVFEVELLAIE